MKISSRSSRGVSGRASAMLLNFLHKFPLRFHKCVQHLHLMLHQELCQEIFLEIYLKLQSGSCAKLRILCISCNNFIKVLPWNNKKIKKKEFLAISPNYNHFFSHGHDLYNKNSEVFLKIVTVVSWQKIHGLYWEEDDIQKVLIYSFSKLRSE